jgi:hypothetical protein
MGSCMGDMGCFRHLMLELTGAGLSRVRWSDWLGRTHATGTTTTF